MIEKTTVDTGALHPSHVFRGGEGLAGNYINCYDNPYDLRPAADIIVGAAHKMMEDLPEGTPLVILMGEVHSMPAHKELQHMVASRLLEDEDKFTVNFEFPHNEWATEAQKSMGFDVPEPLYYDCSSYDGNGRGALSAFMGFADTSGAPVARHNMMAFCYDREIPAVFNDAARNGNYLDLKDPYTAAVANEYAREHGLMAQKIHILDSIGIAIRNIVMAQRGVSHAKQSGASLILQLVGGGHVFGYTNTGDSYEDSLCAAYRRAGAALIDGIKTRPSFKFFWPGSYFIIRKTFFACPHIMRAIGQRQRPRCIVRPRLRFYRPDHSSIGTNSPIYSMPSGKIILFPT